MEMGVCVLSACSGEAIYHLRVRDASESACHAVRAAILKPYFSIALLCNGQVVCEDQSWTDLDYPEAIEAVHPEHQRPWVWEGL